MGETVDGARYCSYAYMSCRTKAAYWYVAVSVLCTGMPCDAGVERTGGDRECVFTDTGGTDTLRYADTQ